MMATTEITDGSTTHIGKNKSRFNANGTVDVLILNHCLCPHPSSPPCNSQAFLSSSFPLASSASNDNSCTSTTSVRTAAATTYNDKLRIITSDADTATSNTSTARRQENYTEEKDEEEDPSILKPFLTQSENFYNINNNNSRYLPGHYDVEQPQHIMPPNRESEARDCWEAFEPYLRDGIPVKISNILSFRRLNDNIDGNGSNGDIEKKWYGNNNNVIDSAAKNGRGRKKKRKRDDEKAQIAGKSYKDHESCHGGGDVRDFLEGMNFPEHILDMEVTVQCESLAGQRNDSTHNVHHSDCRKGRRMIEDLAETEEERQQVIYDTLTVAPRYCKVKLKTDIHNRNDTTQKQQKMERKQVLMFHGQEDQLTQQMKLRNVFFRNNIIHCDSLQICVAQETILSCRDVDDGGNDKSNTISSFISCTESGLLTEYRKKYPPPPLAALRKHIRAPAYLLPPQRVCLREVNFWYAPPSNNKEQQYSSCATNTHYDGHHNLLIVYAGRKIVELNPPGSIRPYGIYSDHANHASLLQYSHRHKHCRNREEDEMFWKEVNDTRRERMQTSMVVSISAGEGLFIPEGWWHRVESIPVCSTSGTVSSSSGCMAINYWFDHCKYSAVSSLLPSLVVNNDCAGSIKNCNDDVHHNDLIFGNRGKHMLPYKAREAVRYFIEEHFDDVSRMLIQDDTKKIEFLFKTKLFESKNSMANRKCYDAISNGCTSSSESCDSLSSSSYTSADSAEGDEEYNIDYTEIITTMKSIRDMLRKAEEETKFKSEDGSDGPSPPAKLSFLIFYRGEKEKCDIHRSLNNKESTQRSHRAKTMFFRPVDIASNLLNWLLLHVDTSKVLHRLLILQMLENYFPPSSSQVIMPSRTLPQLSPSTSVANHFSHVMKGLKPASCFILTQIWEKHSNNRCVGDLCFNTNEGIKPALNQEKDADHYCMNFFLKCGREDQIIKSHLRQGVDFFKKRVAKHLVINDLALC